MKRAKGRVFTHVINHDTGQKGVIQDVLSAQITVIYDDNTFGFLLFKYRGSEWEYLL